MSTKTIDAWPRINTCGDEAFEVALSSMDQFWKVFFFANLMNESGLDGI